MDSFIFLTTSDFGYFIGEYLFKNYEVKAVVTSNPKPKGRHFIIEDIETVKLAKNFNIPIIYIEKSNQIYDKIKNIIVDYLVVVDFAFILKKEVLEHPKKYSINIHPSLLPKYRGPSPLHYQIIDNVKNTGISIIKMSDKIDAGDILFQVSTEMDYWYTFTNFYKNMQQFSVYAFQLFIANSSYLYPQVQDENLATYTKKIKKNDAFIDFKNEDRIKAIGKIKAFEKWPKVKIMVEDDILILLDAKPKDDVDFIPGKITVTDEDIIIGAKNGAISIDKIQRPGKSLQSKKTFLLGYRKRFKFKDIISNFNT